MRIKQLLMGIVASVIAVSSYVEIAIADLKFPMLVYRTGAYAPNGIPNADGFVDYYKMINASSVPNHVAYGGNFLLLYCNVHAAGTHGCVLWRPWFWSGDRSEDAVDNACIWCC